MLSGWIGNLGVVPFFSSFFLRARPILVDLFWRRVLVLLVADMGRVVAGPPLPGKGIFMC